MEERSLGSPKEISPTPQGRPKWMEEEKIKAKEPYKPNCTEEQRHQIEVLTLKLTPYFRRCLQWVAENVLTKHPESIILALQRLDEIRPTNPYEYANKIVAVESGNFREQEFGLKHPNPWKNRNRGPTSLGEAPRQGLGGVIDEK